MLSDCAANAPNLPASAPLDFFALTDTPYVVFITTILIA